MLWSESEKFRADIHRISGFTFMSPLCLKVLEFLNTNLPWTMNFNPKLLIKLVLFIIGYLFLVNSLDILRELEKNKVGARKWK